MCKLIATIFLSLSMMGCASYRAPKDKNAATLTSSVKILGITSVDGHSVCSVIQVEGVREVRLSPGKHSVHVIVLLGGYYAEGDLWFIAAPWGYYELRYSRKEMRVAVWIVDKSTGQPVGGIKGSDDEPPDSVDQQEDRQYSPRVRGREI